MKRKILELLKSNTDYISGQQLCDRFGVSRTAVWKAVNQLKKDGYKIEAVQNKGYKLLDAADILSVEEIKSCMHNTWAAQSVYYYDEVDSTNDKAKQLAEAGEPHGTLVVAEKQTLGKGRRGKGWVSPPGTSIYMTILLKPQFAPNSASKLTLVMALAVVKGVEEITNMPCQIKWPNDIIINKKKICGILTEMQAEPDYIQHVVIGAGINVNLEKIPDEIADMATSLYATCGRKFLRAEIIAAVMRHFEYFYNIFVQTEELSALMKEYNAHLVNIGQPVKVLNPKCEFTGIAEGINKEGELLVRTEHGEIVCVYAGIVSVRGLYGYV